ncbi:MAG: squalene synthase HpnC [Acidobacteriota bacterium]
MSTAAGHHATGFSQAIHGPQITARSWTLESAYRYCTLLTKSHYENFPVGSALVPARLRKHFSSIYAFARTADDFADEAYDEEHGEQERLDLLEEWREMLRATHGGQATHPVFIALAETIARFELPLSLFEDLLTAFAQDVIVRRYQSFDQVIDYCRRSANPVGRLILLLFGHTDQQLHAWSDDICTALQLTNHWQDVRVDLEKDRIYLPSEDLARFDVAEGDLRSERAGEGFERLMKFEVGRARELFARGKPLCTSVGGRFGLELRAVWLGGTRILDRIEQNGFDVLTRRPVITNGDKLKILYQAAVSAGFGPY